MSPVVGAEPRARWRSLQRSPEPLAGREGLTTPSLKPCPISTLRVSVGHSGRSGRLPIVVKSGLL